MLRIYQFPAGTQDSDGATRGNRIEVPSQWPRVHVRHYRYMRRRGVSARVAREILWDLIFDVYLRGATFTPWHQL